MKFYYGIDYNSFEPFIGCYQLPKDRWFIKDWHYKPSTFIQIITKETSIPEYKILPMVMHFLTKKYSQEVFEII